MAEEPSNAVILERVEVLRCDVVALTSLFAKHAEEERKSREAALIDRMRVENEVKQASHRLDTVEPKLDNLEKSMVSYNTNLNRLIDQVRIMTAVLAFIGFGVGSWLITQVLSLIK